MIILDCVKLKKISKKKRINSLAHQLLHINYTTFKLDITMTSLNLLLNIVSDGIVS